MSMSGYCKPYRLIAMQQQQKTETEKRVNVHNTTHILHVEISSRKLYLLIKQLMVVRFDSLDANLSSFFFLFLCFYLLSIHMALPMWLIQILTSHCIIFCAFIKLSFFSTLYLIETKRNKQQQQKNCILVLLAVTTSNDPTIKSNKSAFLILILPGLDFALSNTTQQTKK